jgi:hypothetical protein
MTIIFSDEDLLYLDKEQDDQLRSIRQAIDSIKAKGGHHFVKNVAMLCNISPLEMQSFSSAVSVGIE